MTEMLSQLADQHIISLMQEACAGGEEHETARRLFRRELARRGLYYASEDSTGLYDASQDNYQNPDHDDSRWA